nr:coiled-coil and C2 domain-containing protein 1-like isoform X1 [Leptinotarsa decemlineata]
MFSRNEKKKKNHSGKSLSQYGLFDIPSNFDESGNEDNDNDSDLEAELAALSGGGNPTPQRKKPAKKILPEREINAMVADSMKDIDDDDVSVDENDPDLLSELSELTGGAAEDDLPSPQNETQSAGSTDTKNILSERLKNYEIAEKTAKESGETSKSRRYGRAIKTLKDLLKQAKSGKLIDLNDETVPPEIHPVSQKPPSQPVPTRPAPAIPPRAPVSQEDAGNNVSSPLLLPETVEENVRKEKENIDEELLNMLRERQKEYKVAALSAKKAGDSKNAIMFVKIAKQFEAVIAAVQNGQEVDLSKMPGPPSEVSLKSEPKIEDSETQRNTAPEIALPEEAAGLPEPQLITASTDLEALEQRLAFYKEHETKAKEEGNSSKARRYGRLVKQFEQALKLQKAGKPVAFDELPTPPGFGPFPTLAKAEAASKPAVNMPAQPPKTDSTENEDKRQISAEGPKLSGNTTHAEKQVLILLAKQKQFKQAALHAKKQGEINQAKEYLKQAKGFDKLIEAAQAGLPVDWSSIPVSPEAKSQLDNEYDIIMSDELDENRSEDMDLLARLENQLQKQLKMCLTTRDHNKALGDVASMNKFERLALNVTKDLDVIRMARKSSKIVPKFHYEQKDFSIVKSFTEIMDNQMEVTIHRGINYQSDNPKEIDTYVKLEFPFPQDTPFSDRTSTIKDTNNPEYQKTFVIPIQRNSRQCQRTFKRHGIKFEIYSKGCSCCFSGFFRSDVLIGTVNVKLQPLETQCEIHESFDLLDGRKKVGGKLEVQIKLRTPIVTQQVEHIQEKWLIIDQ